MITSFSSLKDKYFFLDFIIQSSLSIKIGVTKKERSYTGAGSDRHGLPFPIPARPPRDRSLRLGELRMTEPDHHLCNAQTHGPSALDHRKSQQSNDLTSDSQGWFLTRSPRIQPPHYRRTEGKSVPRLLYFIAKIPDSASAHNPT